MGAADATDVGATDVGAADVGAADVGATDVGAAHGRDPVNVEIVYALAERQLVLAVKVEPGATVRQAIEASGILREFPEIDLRRHRVGVFGRLRGLDEVAQPGDRIEIYRPLPADPKEMRRRRASSSSAA